MLKNEYLEALQKLEQKNITLSLGGIQSPAHREIGNWLHISLNGDGRLGVRVSWFVLEEER